MDPNEAKRLDDQMNKILSDTGLTLGAIVVLILNDRHVDLQEVMDRKREADTTFPKATDIQPK